MILVWEDCSSHFPLQLTYSFSQTFLFLFFLLLNIILSFCALIPYPKNPHIVPESYSSFYSFIYSLLHIILLQFCTIADKFCALYFCRVIINQLIPDPKHTKLISHKKNKKTLHIQFSFSSKQLIVVIFWHKSNILL